MMTKYISVCGSIELTYVDGRLCVIRCLPDCDKISLEALRHEITMYEDEVNKNLFKLVDGDK